MVRFFKKVLRHYHSNAFISFFLQIFTITHFLVRRERFHIIFCTYNSATFIAVFLLHTYSFYTRSGKLFRFSDAFYRALEKEALYCHCSYYTGRIFFNEVWKIAAQHSMQKFVFYYELVVFSLHM